MKAFALLTLLLAQSALADTFKYRLYYDENKTEALDIQLELTLSGKFEKGSKVKGLKIWGESKKQSILLFDIPADELTGKWKSKNTLNLSSKMTHEPTVKSEYIAIHSDTNINPGEEYSFDNLVITEEGTVETDLEGFYLGNQTVEEMGLNGFLKKMNSDKATQNLCAENASKAVLKVATENNKGWDVIRSVCAKAPRSSANLCEVSGSHEDGAGTKDFLVVMSSDCKKVYEVRLTGEE